MYALFAKGGPIMWPLLLCSVLSLTITIERMLFWWRARRRRNDGVVEQLFLHAEQGDFVTALSAGGGAEDVAAKRRP